jgi:GNAT superfamily N-acetyltransferase
MALRDAILRRPLGLQLSADELDGDKDAIHIACYRGDRLAGCLRLCPLEGGSLRMRGVAVDAELQGKGIGTALVEYAEALARTLGYRRMVLHARETALPFYEKLGYARIGEREVRFTIPHWEMAKQLAEAKS